MRARRLAGVKLGDFDVMGRIGDGSFSTVILARYRASGDQYAIKIVNKHLVLRNKMVEYVKNERTILDALDYDGIVRLHFTFQDADSLCGCMASGHGMERATSATTVMHCACVCAAQPPPPTPHGGRRLRP